MPISQEEILRLRKQYGFDQPSSGGTTTVPGQGASAEQRINDLWGPPVTPQRPERFDADGVIGVVQDVAKGAAKRGTKTILDIGHLGQKLQGVVGKGLDAVTGDRFGFEEDSEEGVFSPNSAQGQKIRREMEPENLAERIGGGIEQIAELAVPIGGAPAKTILGKTAQGAAIGGGFGAAHSVADDESLGEVAKDTAIGVGAGAALGLAGGVIGKFANRKGKIFPSGKTTDEVLATPEAELHKLSTPERNYYFANQKAALDKRINAATEKATKEADKSLKQLEDEASSLTRDLAVASRDEVIRLRPKIRSSLGKQSAKYRQLVSEQLDEVEDVVIEEAPLVDYVRARFAEVPGQADTVLSRLGLRNIESIAQGRSTTIGQIASRMKGLKAEIGSSAKAGTRVYTPDEKLTDDAVHTLASFLKENGVDLAEANKFWAQYAPIRNQLLREAKPFIQSDVQTKTFANTLTRVLEGKDVNNEKFIEEVGTLVDDDIGAGVKAILKKMDTNQKEIVAKKLELEGQKLEQKLAKEAALSNLTDEEFEVARKAGWRKLIRVTLIGTMGTGILLGLGNKVVNAFTGGGREGGN